MIEKFEDLEAWKQARKLVSLIYTATREKSIARDYGLCSQIQRAGVSIMSNVAEGFERSHVAEKLQFYNVARSSSGEVRSLTYVIEDNYAELKDTAKELRERTMEVGRVTSGLVSSTERRRRSLKTFLLSLLNL